VGVGGIIYLVNILAFRGGPGFLWLAVESGESDLRGVEEACAVLVGDGADEHTVGGAGDEIADAFVVKERRHGIAVRYASVSHGEEIVCAVRFFGFVTVLPGFAASRDD
jgi:hypothetical protein